MNRRAQLVGLVVALVLVASCSDFVGVHGPNNIGRPGSPSLEEVYYGGGGAANDSSPAACAHFDCSSLGPGEKQDLLDDIWEAIQMAAMWDDAECFSLWVNAYGKVDGNRVFKMAMNKAFDPNGNSIRGAYNAGYGDLYIRPDLFASPRDMLNTVGHETGHALGYSHVSSPSTQALADWCTPNW